MTLPGGSCPEQGDRPTMGPAFFILSSGRSGSTLLASMLNMHPQVHVPVELFGLYTSLPRALPWYGDLNQDFNRLLLARDLAHIGQLGEFGVGFDVDGFVARLERASRDLAGVINCFYATLLAASDKALLGDKTPNHSPQLSLIESIFPAMRVVHLIRDGRDCAASSARARAGINRRNVYELACLWPRNNAAIERFGVRNPDRYHSLRYERLIEDPQGCLEKLCVFLGVPFDPAMLDYPAGDFARGNAERLAQHANLARGVLRGNREKWRVELAQSEIRLYESIAGDALRHFEYALSGLEGKVPGLRLRCQAVTGYRRMRRALRAVSVEGRRFMVLVLKRLLHAVGLLGDRPA